MLPKTFRMQVYYALIFGVGLMLIGQLKSDGGTDAAEFFFLGLVILAVGALVRPIHRRHWLSTMESVDDTRQDSARLLVQGTFGGFWRGWLHVTDEGADRDART